MQKKDRSRRERGEGAEGTGGLANGPNYGRGQGTMQFVQTVCFATTPVGPVHMRLPLLTYIGRVLILGTEDAMIKTRTGGNVGCCTSLV